MPPFDPHQTLDRMRRILGPKFEELAGARLDGELPLTNAVLNALVAERLRASETPVEKAEVQVRADGELFARVELRRSFLPAVIIGARIEQQPDLPRSAVVVFRWWLPGAGALSVLAGPVLAFFKAGPPWLAVDGQHVRVDLAGLIRDQGAGEFLPFLKSLHVGTREGAVLVRFGLQVPPPRVD